MRNTNTVVSEMNRMPGEATIWLQATSDAKVSVAYSDSASGRVYNTQTTTVDASTHHTVKLVCDSVEPGRTYTYEVFINGKKCTFAYPTQFRSQPLWKYQTSETSGHDAVAWRQHLPARA